MTALPDIDGLARFDRMIITTPGRFALRFSLGSLPPITSSPFIVRSRASSLVFTEPPPAYAEAGRAFRVAVELRDASGGVAEAEAGTVRIGSHGWDFSVGGTTQARCPPVTSGCGLGAAARAHMPPRQVVVVDGVAVFEAVLLHMATDSTHHAYVLPSTIQLQAFFDRRAAALILALRLPRPCPALSNPLTRPPHTGTRLHAHTAACAPLRVCCRSASYVGLLEQSVPFAVRSAAPAELRFVTQPPRLVRAGEPLVPAPTLRVLDAYGNTASARTDGDGRVRRADLVGRMELRPSCEAVSAAEAVRCDTAERDGLAWSSFVEAGLLRFNHTVARTPGRRCASCGAA